MWEALIIFPEKLKDRYGLSTKHLPAEQEDQEIAGSRYKPT